MSKMHGKNNSKLSNIILYTSVRYTNTSIIPCCKWPNLHVIFQGDDCFECALENILLSRTY